MFRDNHQLIRADHDKRGIPHDKIDEVIKYDKLWLNLQHQTNQLRQQKIPLLEA
jgi:seryl-tRNA synthetase